MPSHTKVNFAPATIQRIAENPGVISGIIVVVWMSLSPIFFKDDFLGEYASPFHANLTIVFGTIVIFLVGFVSIHLLKKKQ